MVVAGINVIPVGSTGKIMLDVANAARQEGIEMYTYSFKIFRRKMKYTYSPMIYHTYIGSETGNFMHKVLGSITGFNGYFSCFSTLRLIRELKEKRVEILHLHNLHEFCINLPLLFQFIKRENLKVVWTLHDCWTFTGHCPHFTIADCERWKHGCGNCPQLSVYPRSCIDTTRMMWKAKEHMFTNIDRATIVVPSKWLASLVSQSYLNKHPVRVINNGIDLSVFKPTPSDFRKEYGIGSKTILLGVAFGWESRKGLDVFIELGKRLDSSQYQIVLAGTNDAVDQALPRSIISIHRTSDQHELAKIYTAADLLVNPTREDNFPTVNIEAIACGTPVVTFRTGGSPEILNEKTGAVVEPDDIDALQMTIEQVCSQHSFSERDCLERAKDFNKRDKFKEYVDLYKEIQQ